MTETTEPVNDKLEMNEPSDAVMLLGFMKGEILKKNINELVERGTIKLDESKIATNKREYTTTNNPKRRIHVIIEPAMVYNIEEELR